MSINLPKPIAAYFAAEKAGDAGALARCFASTGVVHDEGGSFTGRAAIEQWNTTARAKYHHTVVPLSATERDGATVVIGQSVRRVPRQPGGTPTCVHNRRRTDRVVGDSLTASAELRVPVRGRHATCLPNP